MTLRVCASSLIAACIVVVFVVLALSSNDVTRVSTANMALAYVATNNSMFAVCSYDKDNARLLRWHGVNIERSALPITSDLRQDMVFDWGEHPAKGMTSTVALSTWDVSSEWRHSYGPVPFPIMDVEPALSAWPLEHGTVGIGVRGHNRFFVFCETTLLFTNVASRSWTVLETGSVSLVRVKPPSHRQEEISDFLTNRLRRSHSSDL